MMGLAAVIFGIVALVGLLGSILANGASSFRQTYIALDVYLDPAKLDKAGNRAPEALQKVTTFGYAPLINAALQDLIEKRGIVAAKAVNKDVSGAHIERGAAQIRRFVLANPSQIGETVTFIFSQMAVLTATTRAASPWKQPNLTVISRLSSCCSPTN
jgi:phosphate transport system permease protein